LILCSYLYMHIHIILHTFHFGLDFVFGHHCTMPVHVHELLFSLPHLDTGRVLPRTYLSRCPFPGWFGHSHLPPHAPRSGPHLHWFTHTCAVPSARGSSSRLPRTPSFSFTFSGSFHFLFTRSSWFHLCLWSACYTTFEPRHTFVRLPLPACALFSRFTPRYHRTPDIPFGPPHTCDATLPGLYAHTATHTPHGAPHLPFLLHHSRTVPARLFALGHHLSPPRITPVVDTPRCTYHAHTSFGFRVRSHRRTFTAFLSVLGSGLVCHLHTAPLPLAAHAGHLHLPVARTFPHGFGFSFTTLPGSFATVHWTLRRHHTAQFLRTFCTRLEIFLHVVFHRLVHCRLHLWDHSAVTLHFTAHVH